MLDTYVGWRTDYLLERVAMKLMFETGRAMAELYDSNKFSVLITVKIKDYSSGYTKFLTIRNQIFFQDTYFIGGPLFLFY